MSTKRYDQNRQRILPVLSEEQGGTGATTLQTAKVNLGVVSNTDVNTANKPVTLNAEGKCDLLFITPTITEVLVNSVDGKHNVFFPGCSYDFKITNYNINSTYTLTAPTGVISRTDNIIHFTTPSELGGTYFTVNGKYVPVMVVSPSLAVPVITSPSNNAVNQSLILSIITNGHPDGPLKSLWDYTSWQLSTSDTFSTLVTSTTNPASKQNWSGVNLNVNTLYYVRGRYHYSDGTFSDYSTPVSFTTKSTRYTIDTTLYAVDTNLVDKNGNSPLGFFMSADGTRFFISSNTGLGLGAVATGYVLIYRYENNSWVLEEKITPETDAMANAGYVGKAIAINSTGDILVIGCPRITVGSSANSGDFIVYQRIDNRWRVKARVLNPYSLVSGYLAEAISISDDGDRIAVNMRGVDTHGTLGPVIVFKRTINAVKNMWTYSLEAYLKQSNYASGDNLGINGIKMTPDGMRVIASTINNSGKAVVFVRSGTTWSEEGILTPSIAGDAGTISNYGNCCSISNDGTRAIVCASTSTNSLGTTYPGKAFLFTRSGSVWTQETILKHQTPSISNPGSFGNSVVMSADGLAILIGTKNGATEAPPFHSHIFKYNGTNWYCDQQLTNPSGMAIEYFGTSVAMNANATCLLLTKPYAAGYISIFRG